jgi:putative acetyltransferase
MLSVGRGGIEPTQDADNVALSVVWQHGAVAPESQISRDDPRAVDVRVLLERHLALATENSPPEDVHALDSNGLVDTEVLFFSFRRNGFLLGIGALRLLNTDHAELKSMHTAEAARRQGVGRAMLEHLIRVARAHGARRVSLETGTMEAFAPARALYAQAGFEPCEPFGDYVASPNSTFMTLWIDRDTERSGVSVGSQG